MKILLITFSGTGNTLLCGNYIQKHFESFSHEVTHYVYNIKNKFEYNLDDFDMIGIGYPIHAFNIAKPFYKFLKTLQKAKEKKPLFIYKVSGEPFPMNNSSSCKPLRLLKKKNLKLVAEKHFLMPYNIIFRYKDGLAKQMYLYLEPLTKVFVEGILNNKPERIRHGVGSHIFSFLFRIEWIAPFVNKPLLHSKKKKCSKCMMCVKNCPTQSLYLNKKGTIKAHTSCALCMRCSYNCPNDAMNMGFLNLWVVNGPFKYEKIASNPEIKGDFVNKKTKGYFKLFKKYFKRQNELLKEFGYEVPVSYNETEALWLCL